MKSNSLLSPPNPKLQIGELNPQEEKILVDMLHSCHHEVSQIPIAAPAPPKSKAERYAYEPVDEISHNIISGKMTLPESPTDLKAIIAKPQPPPPPPTHQLDPEEFKQRLKHINDLNNENKKTRKEREEEESKRIKENQDRRRKQLEQDEERIRKQKQQRAKKRLEEIQQMKKKRKEANVNADKQLNKLKGSRTIDQINASRYNKEFVLPKIQEQKRKLQFVKINKRPISIDQILDHEKKYIQTRQKILSKKKYTEEWHYTPPAYKSRSYQTLLQQEKQIDEEIQKKAKQKAQMQSNKAKLLQMLKGQSKAFKPKRTNNDTEKDVDKINQAYDREKNRKEKGNSYLAEIKKKIQSNKVKAESNERQVKQNHQNSKLTTVDEVEKTKDLPQKKSNFEIIKIHNMNIQNLAKDRKRSLTQRQKLLQYEADRMDELIERKKFLQKVRKQPQEQLDQTMDIVMASVRAKLAIVNINKPDHSKTDAKNLTDQKVQRPSSED